MPETVSFPTTSFNNSVRSTIKVFDFNAMLLVALNRYCHQLIFFEMCGMPFNFNQSYTYNFSDFEIKSLGQTEDIIYKKHLEAPFDFTLSLYKKQFSGNIIIDSQFNNHGTLEKSSYSININIIPKTDLKIYPFFLKPQAFISHMSEFMQKMWQSVFLELENIRLKNQVITHNYKINELVVLPFENQLNFSHLPLAIKDITADVFYLTTTIIFNLKKQSEYCLISADDIMSARELKENKNANGFSGGYKNHERQKIHSALFLLNISNCLIVREINPYNYIIKLPFNKQFQSKKVLPKILATYSYKSNLWKKRLGYYLSINKPEHLKVKELYSNTNELCNSFKPSQIRDKFEYSMDHLVSDRILKFWHYSNIDENKMSGKNWFSIWLETKIICRYYN